MLTAGDKAQLAAKAEALERFQADEDLKAVMAAPAGQRFVYRLAEYCGIRTHAVVSSPELLAYSEGRRSIGVDLLDDAQRVAPQAFVEMMRERLNHENAKAATRAAHAVPGTGDRSTT